MLPLATPPKAIIWWLPHKLLAVIKLFIFKELTLNVHYSTINKLTVQLLYTLVIYRIKIHNVRRSLAQALSRLHRLLPSLALALLGSTHAATLSTPMAAWIRQHFYHP